MPLINMVGPLTTDLAPSFGRTDRIIADFGVTLRMRIDARAEITGHHLGTKTDPKIRLLVAQRHTNPVDFSLHKILVVVGALRTAKDYGSGMAVHCFRQRIAEAGTPDVERIA